MEQKYTVAEVLTMTIDYLESIAVPRKLNEQIGIPIDRAIDNLRKCVDAMKQEPEDIAKGQEQPDENA